MTKKKINLEAILGREAEKTKNNNGERIIKLAEENNSSIAKIKFLHKTIW